MSAYGPQNRHVLAVAACRLLGDERTSIRHRLRSVYDPGCVKTPWCCYDSRVILAGGIDEALR